MLKLLMILIIAIIGEFFLFVCYLITERLEEYTGDYIVITAIQIILVILMALLSLPIFKYAGTLFKTLA